MGKDRSVRDTAHDITGKSKEGGIIGTSKNLIGQRFGKLIVVEKTEEKRDGYWLWLCRCDCGRHTLASTRQLNRGTTRDCGCVPKRTARNGPRREDLKGRRFGKLTVLSPAETKNGRTCWTCRCACGNIHLATSHDLKAGKVKSCGCSHYQKGTGIRDLAGKRFGRLVVLSLTEQRDKRGSAIWHCRCDCGRETDASENALMFGNCKSCGCLKQEMQKHISDQLHWVDDTCLEWLEKRKHRRDNTSGFRGVFRLKNGHYRVDIGFRKQRYHIGTFTDFNEAVRARLEAEEMIHGRFVNAYYRWKSQGCEGPFDFEVIKTEQGFCVKCNIV